MRVISIARTLLVGLILIGVPALSSYAHEGSRNPTTEGWTLVAGDAGASGFALADPDYPVLGAWEIDEPGAETLRYRRPGPGSAGSWILESRLRVVELDDPADAGIQLEVANGASRFALDFGSDAQGGTLIDLVGAGVSVTIAPLSAPGVRTDYVNVQLVYSAVDGSADLFVNGLEVASDWVGDPSALDRVVFGDGSSEPGGRARYARVRIVHGAAACRNGSDEDWWDRRLDFAGGDPDCSQENDPTERGPQDMWQPGCSYEYPNVDTDGDSICDWDEGLVGSSAADSDSDDDGVEDGVELRWSTLPFDPDTDGDGVSDGDELSAGRDPLVAGETSDLDGDGVADVRDNCITIANGPNDSSNQFDGSLDGYGNRCDADFNNDGAANGGDFGIFIASFGTANPIIDLSGDGVTTGNDFGLFVSLFNTVPGPSGLACAGTIPCRP